MASASRVGQGGPGAGRRWVVVGAASAVIVSVGLVVAVRDASPYPWLVPWVLVTWAAVVLVIMTTPEDRGSDLLDPVPVAAALYFIPLAVFGSLLLAGGWATPYYTVLIVDPRSSLPLAQWYLTVGFVAVALASRLPFWRGTARGLDRVVPHVALDRRDIAVPLGGLYLGLAAVYWSFREGYVGYEGALSGGLGAIPVYLATLTIAARIGVAMAWVAAPKPRPLALRLALGLSILGLPVEVAMIGNRGAVLGALLAYGFGSVAAGWRPTPVRLLAIALPAVLLVFVAVSFGTTFRSLKRTEGAVDAVSTREQASLALDAARETVTRGPTVVPDALDAIGERLEAVGQVAVVVSQYEERVDEERAAGLDDSVRQAIIAGLVPRVISSSKPEPPEVRAIGRVYFEFGGNSFATTPMTDLLRNYGPVGVVVGMGLLGAVLGVIGCFRRRRAAFIATNVVIGTVLLRAVSYESFYGTIPSEMVRVGGVAVVAVLLLRLASRSRPDVTPPPSGETPGRRLTLVSVDLSQRGGHQSVVRFLRSALVSCGWEVAVVSMATSSQDRNSFVLRSPRRWRRPTVTDEVFDDINFRHVGCWFADLAPLRCRPRRALTAELRDSDVIVLGVGVPFWGRGVPPELQSRLVLEFVTLLGDESVSAFETAGLSRRALMRLWAPIVARQERRAARDAAAVIVPSFAMAHWARVQGATDITILPHAIDPVFVPGDRRDEVAIAIGRWNDPRKNLPLLLSAFADAGTHADVPPLRLIGTPPTTEQLESDEIAEAVAALGPRVRFDGEVSQADLVAAMQQAAFLVSASNQEGFGLPLVEAMACGCPVVATRSGGVEQTMTDEVDALLVPPRDVEALGAAIVRMATEPGLRARLAAEGLANSGRYAVPTIAAQLDEVVERVADAASSRSRTSIASA